MRTIEQYLPDHPFFAGLDPKAVAVVAACATNVSFKTGEFLFRSSWFAAAGLPSRCTVPPLARWWLTRPTRATSSAGLGSCRHTAGYSTHAPLSPPVRSPSTELAFETSASRTHNLDTSS